jgi:hypothetical protein
VPHTAPVAAPRSCSTHSELPVRQLIDRCHRRLSQSHHTQVREHQSCDATQHGGSHAAAITSRLPPHDHGCVSNRDHDPVVCRSGRAVHASEERPFGARVLCLWPRGHDSVSVHRQATATATAAVSTGPTGERPSAATRRYCRRGGRTCRKSRIACHGPLHDVQLTANLLSGLHRRPRLQLGDLVRLQASRCTPPRGCCVHRGRTNRGCAVPEGDGRPCSSTAQLCWVFYLSRAAGQPSDKTVSE